MNEGAKIEKTPRTPHCETREDTLDCVILMQRAAIQCERDTNATTFQNWEYVQRGGDRGKGLRI